MRVTLIVLLVFQVLVAQAGVFGMANGHDFAGIDTSAAHPHTADGSHTAATVHDGHASESDESDTHERCCCAFAGHCSASAVTTPVRDRTPFSPPAHCAPPVTAGLASGFDSPPYRPPSFL